MLSVGAWADPGPVVRALSAGCSGVNLVLGGGSQSLNRGTEAVLLALEKPIGQCGVKNYLSPGRYERCVAVASNTIVIR